jgi:hypothetical protein
MGTAGCSRRKGNCIAQGRDWRREGNELSSRSLAIVAVQLHTLDGGKCKACMGQRGNFVWLRPTICSPRTAAPSRHTRQRERSKRPFLRPYVC